MSINCNYFVFQNDNISPDKFTFEEFWAFYNRLCDRKDIDTIFAEMYVPVTMIVTLSNNNYYFNSNNIMLVLFWVGFSVTLVNGRVF